MAFDPDINELFQGIRQGNKVFLARAITLLESTLPAHQSQAINLLTLAWPYLGKAMKIAVTGAPGVGKSSMIEVLGAHFVNTGHKVAVLAIDPSSQQSKGSILGDKTRMNRLSQLDDAFIRPSPNSLELGGVSPATRESIVLCEAAGFDIVILETVGVGQSEIQVSEMADLVLLLLAPGSGDHLQGIKKGIMESADLIAVTKADGSLQEAAGRLKTELRHSLTLQQHADQDAEILLTSAINGMNIDKLGDQLTGLYRTKLENGDLAHHRAENMLKWFDQSLKVNLLRKIYASDTFQANIEEIKSSSDFSTTVIPLIISKLLDQWSFIKH